MTEVVKKRVFKQFNYKGKSLEELMEMPLSKFAELLPSKLRRHIRRGITKYEDDLLKKVSQANEDAELMKVPIKTYERSMVVFPCMVGLTIAVHCGNGFYPIEIKPEMIGMRLRDFVLTRVICRHGKPGVGSTGGSKFVPLK
ncbi:small subunit ribosomal protein S19 [Pancytospora epiphaga]|nr:small subunit ribosomal protein S19 [Pancytospora epiphaga]